MFDSFLHDRFNHVSRIGSIYRPSLLNNINCQMNSLGGASRGRFLALEDERAREDRVTVRRLSSFTYHGRPEIMST